MTRDKLIKELIQIEIQAFMSLSEEEVLQFVIGVFVEGFDNYTDKELRAYYKKVTGKKVK